MNISGVFQVEVSSLEPSIEGEDGISFGRLHIEKTYSGELSATSLCELLNINTPVDGSAGYIALEQITGSLCGKKGSFVIQEYAVMTQGEESSIREVIPDSGTGQLSGLKGTMKTMRKGQHYVYEFDFYLPEQSSQQEDESHIDDKDLLMESILGTEHSSAWFSLIPYTLGGSLNQHYYPNGIKGTAIATKQLALHVEHVPMNDKYSLYELVMFTQAVIEREQEGDKSLNFEQACSHFSEILNVLAPYCIKNKVNPYHTAETPAELSEIGGKCFIFSDYKSNSEAYKQHFGMMLVMEIFPSELEYARQHGGERLIKLLKEHNHYPYSDMNRMPIV